LRYRGARKGKSLERAEEVAVGKRSKLGVELLTKAFHKNLELAFREETSVVERLEVQTAQK
jgi:hypothetical protein